MNVIIIINCAVWLLDDSSRVTDNAKDVSMPTVSVMGWLANCTSAVCGFGLLNAQGCCISNFVA